MVQDYQSPMRVYKYPFEHVMVAYERRFPRCPQIPVVLECVVTEDRWAADWSQRHTTRRCQLHVEAPYLLKKIIGVETVFFIQKNHLDRKNKSLYIEATNESFNTRVQVIEKCRYFVHPDNADWTCFEQSVTLDVKNFYGFENAIEKIAMKQYSANISKGKEIIEFFILEIRKEGITEVAPWSADAEETNLAVRSLICSGQDHDVLVYSPEGRPEEFRLDAEYVLRRLGPLDALQQARLIQLRGWLAERQKGKLPSDATLLRFLRARDFHVERAREMLSQSLLWRKRHQVDRTLADYRLPQVLRDYFPGGWHHNDTEGRPLYVLRLGQMDVKGLLKAVGEDGLLKLTLHICEEGLSRMEERTEALGRGVRSWCLLVDLEGLTMRHLWRPAIRALLRIITLVEANYPETMGRVLIIRAPRVFPILWTIVSTFIDENTRSKFLFYGGKDYLQSPGGLADYIPAELVPDFLGGPCQCSTGEGGLVPKSQYSAGAGAGGLSEDSVYRCVSLGKGQAHEVLVENRDPCSVLTWDFDVMRQDIAFSVLKTDELVPPTQELDKGTCGLQTAAEHHRTVLDKGWQEGVHYRRVEPTILCHDGESIQGSHVMTETGAYILQWRWQHAPPAHAPHESGDPLAHTKAQLMFFYEVLTSRDYRGSMCSLQSGASGFSALSGHSCPSR